LSCSGILSVPGQKRAYPLIAGAPTPFSAMTIGTAVFVPKRFGLGWTMNFGHPQARLILIGIALLVLLPPLVVAIIGVLFPGSIHPSGCHTPGCSPLP